MRFRITLPDFTQTKKRLSPLTGFIKSGIELIVGIASLFGGTRVPGLLGVLIITFVFYQVFHGIFNLTAFSGNTSFSATVSLLQIMPLVLGAGAIIGIISQFGRIGRWV